MAEGDLELVAVLRAEDEASPVIQGVQDQLGGMGAAGVPAMGGIATGAERATGSVRGLRTGLGGLSTVLRITGATGAASMVGLASAIFRVGVALRATSAIGGLGGLGAGGGLAALGGPVGLALLGGLAVGGIAAAALARRGDNKTTATSIVNVNVDARGTVTEHRSLADEIAKQAESAVSSRVRFGGLD